MPDLEGRPAAWGRIPAVRRALREPDINAVAYKQQVKGLGFKGLGFRVFGLRLFQGLKFKDQAY